MKSTEDICANRHGGNEQSEEAFKSIELSRNKIARKIIEYLAACGPYGLTTYEASRDLDIAYTTASARLSELKRDGLIKANGDKRKTASGRNAAVYILVD